MSKPVNLLIIDALNLIRRIEAACRNLATDGQSDMNQVSQLCLQAIRKLLRGHQPSHVVAVFDGQGHGWRKTLYPGYKEGRSEMPAPLQQHLDTLQQEWMALGVDSLLSEEDEADDLIASLAYKVLRHRGQVVVVSTDAGFCQLLPYGARQWDHFNGKWLDEDYVRQKFQVASHQLLDYWAMAGQSGNKIPGITGIGPKTATAILSHHGSLKAAFASEETDKHLKKLHNSREAAEISYQLSRLKCDVELGFNLQDIRYNANRPGQ